jgi:cyclophilin family peptidyl-prolyl cis-trans isomerase
MDQETKITYGVIAALIVILGGLAYFLQPMGAETLKKDNPVATTTPEKPLTTTPTTNTPPTTMEQTTFTTATITTNKGTIEIAFGNATPNTVKNFGTLANSQFYNGVRFHRVIKGFMIQAGDPLSKDINQQAAWGTGGPGYKFNDELTGNEQYPQGTVAMANAGPNTNGSQFFIVTANPGAPLPPNYTVFGKVTKGLDVALAIENVATNSSDRPLEDIIIEKVEAK